MCIGNPFCNIPPPIGLINMAANHVELQHGVTVTGDARQLLSDRIHNGLGLAPQAPQTEAELRTHLSGTNMSHLDLVHLAEKQFVQALPYVGATSATGQQVPPSLDARALQAGIARKSWSPLWN